MTEFTMVDLEKPDLKRWPAFEKLRRGVWATLEPGDALFIQRFTWHYVEQCEPSDNISVNFWFGGYCDNMEDLQDLHGAARATPRGAAATSRRRILAHRLTEWIAKASLAPVDIEPHEFLTTWAKRGARVFEVPLYRNLRQFAADLRRGWRRSSAARPTSSTYSGTCATGGSTRARRPSPSSPRARRTGTRRATRSPRSSGLLRADGASDSEDDFAGLDG
ncbi:tRNA-Phe hydroxylase [Aureococcus anophagefferens]|nr:tRNA-Phe hydroxylase [Aureococcus anophagefferens]